MTPEALAAAILNGCSIQGLPPRAQRQAKDIEGAFTTHVLTMMGFDDERIADLGSKVWDLVHHRRAVVAITAQVRTVTLAGIRADAEQAILILVPPHWLAMIEADPVMQMGAVVFTAGKVVPLASGVTDHATLQQRGLAAERHYLQCIQRSNESWEPNGYQRGVLEGAP